MNIYNFWFTWLGFYYVLSSPKFLHILQLYRSRHDFNLLHTRAKVLVCIRIAKQFKFDRVWDPFQGSIIPLLLAFYQFDNFKQIYFSYRFNVF